MNIDRELVLQAHDLLHKGMVNEAHEVLHKLLGVDNDAPEDHQPIAHRRGFDMAFITACRKNGVRAAYVLVDNQSESGMARLLSGGDAQLCAVVDRAMRGLQ
ncbi:hypothetical protein [Pseudomonas taiwanensis]|uniref:hypothetical protein n=1 Tax=Pseudomonas taiwanensis TaxID=470150 RepID=UPI0003FB371E|nr:hypothetical protein [Pseudomonas taiwanensis]